MSHANARLTVHGRLELVRRVDRAGPPGRARGRGAQHLPRYRLQVDPPLARGGPRRPARPAQPRPSPAAQDPRRRSRQQVLALRRTASSARPGSGRWSGLAPSTVHAVLRRHGMHRLAWLDRPTGGTDPPLRTRPARRAGPRRRARSSASCATGGGWRAHGRGSAQTRPHAPSRTPAARSAIEYVHCAIDDHTRLAYAEIHPDENATTCAAFLRAAAAWFATVGITRIERVMTDNALAYRRSRAWAKPSTDLGAATPLHPPLPAPDQRQSRTLQPHPRRRMGLRPTLRQLSRTRRRPPDWLHTYNHHRSHTALGGQPPISPRQQPCWSLQLAAKLAPSRHPQ